MMPPEILNPVLVSVITGLLAAIAGLLVSFARREKALCSGIRSLLRNELVKAHREFVILGKPMTLVDREVVERNYSSYHGLGGNGTGTTLYEELMDVPITR